MYTQIYTLHVDSGAHSYFHKSTALDSLLLGQSRIFLLTPFPSPVSTTGAILFLRNGIFSWPHRPLSTFSPGSGEARRWIHSRVLLETAVCCSHGFPPALNRGSSVPPDRTALTGRARAGSGEREGKDTVRKERGEDWRLDRIDRDTRTAEREERESECPEKKGRFLLVHLLFPFGFEAF